MPYELPNSEDTTASFTLVERPDAYTEVYVLNTGNIVIMIEDGDDEGARTVEYTPDEIARYMALLGAALAASKYADA